MHLHLLSQPKSCSSDVEKVSDNHTYQAKSDKQLLKGKASFRSHNLQSSFTDRGRATTPGSVALSELDLANDRTLCAEGGGFEPLAGPSTYVPIFARCLSPPHVQGSLLHASHVHMSDAVAVSSRWSDGHPGRPSARPTHALRAAAGSALRTAAHLSEMRASPPEVVHQPLSRVSHLGARRGLGGACL